MPPKHSFQAAPLPSHHRRLFQPPPLTQTTPTNPSHTSTLSRADLPRAHQLPESPGLEPNPPSPLPQIPILHQPNHQTVHSQSKITQSAREPAHQQTNTSNTISQQPNLHSHTMAKPVNLHHQPPSLPTKSPTAHCPIHLAAALMEEERMNRSEQ
ncbi:hypothetical protein M0R45_008793 [Rubus argutus]|uniref:Uncharacterized protein n=1 Tax=Rubus argutus TaxID=59490 RepID=A0AAW1Y2B4_RUBAR